MATPLNRALQKLNRSPAIPALRREYLEHLAFVIDRPPEIIRLAVDPHEHLVQVPRLVRIRMALYAPLPGLRRKHSPEPVPPESYRLMADVDIALD